MYSLGQVCILEAKFIALFVSTGPSLYPVGIVYLRGCVCIYSSKGKACIYGAKFVFSGLGLISQCQVCIDGTEFVRQMGVYKG